jgi:predicted SnoaL-like aldol condensation-catalyzing enzyme
MGNSGGQGAVPATAPGDTAEGVWMRRRGHLLFALAAAALVAGCADTGAMLRSARAQQHSAVVLAYLDTLHNRHDAVQAAHLYLAPVFHDHSPAVTVPGRIEVLHTVAQGDLVSVHLRGAGEATGERQALLELFRLYQGKIVDRWAMAGPDDTSGTSPENHFPTPPMPVR